MIDGRNVFYTHVKNLTIESGNIKNIFTGPRDDYTISFVLGYPKIKEHYNIVTIDQRKQQVLEVYLEPIQQINFTFRRDE